MNNYNLVFVILFFGSCISLSFPKESDYENVKIGMTVDSFLDKHSKAKNEYLDRATTIYSITYYQENNGKAFVNSTSEVTYKKFYYFINDSLEKVDKGERMVDYRIKID